VSEKADRVGHQTGQGLREEAADEGHLR
jgi:hypothetical protein